MSNLYVSLEEVTHIIKDARNECADNHGVVRQMERDILGIETIDLSIIDDMIDESMKKKEEIRKCDPVMLIGFSTHTIRLKLLQELKARLLSKK